jgi:hypothetical protein
MAVARSTGAARTAYFTVTLTPEQITHAAGGGAKLTAAVGVKQKRWLASNFRFHLTGLEDACKRVTTIDAFTIKQTILEFVDDASGIRTKHPTTLEIPNLRITFSATDVKPWQDWFDDFVVKGNAGAGNENSGVIEFLDPSLKLTLGTVTLVRCGIFSLDFEPSGGSKKGGSPYVAEPDVQGMQVNLKHV